MSDTTQVPVFHVEPRRFPDLRFQQLGRRQPDLSGSLGDPLEHDPLMGFVELGSQVIQTQQRPFPPMVGEHRRLRQDASQGRQFGLPAREEFPPWSVLELQSPIRVMRTHSRMATYPVLSPVFSQQFL